jgi:POT family proton-dependent oligopeptide transporter
MDTVPSKSLEVAKPDCPPAAAVSAIVPGSTTPSNVPAPVVRTSHPIGFWFIFWGEFAERCSFYGMKAILLLYLIDRLDLGKGVASAWINYFKAACYFLPLAGGYFADNYFGKYRTIVAFSIPYVLGHVILGVESVPYALFALLLLAIGAGATKPNISTLMGLTYDQQRPGQLQLRSDAFAMLYVAINAGGLVSALCVPVVRNLWGYQVAFLFPAGFMTVAFLLFALGKPFYAVEQIGRVDAAPVRRQLDWATLRSILSLFAMTIFFWAVLEQYDNTWVLFARDHIDLNVFDFAEGTWQASALSWIADHLHLDLRGKPLAPDQFQVLNAVLVVVLVPVVTIIWRYLRRWGWRIRPTDKMLVGFVLATATPIILAIAGFRAAEIGRVSAGWLVAAYVVVTAGEVCLSVTALELAFTAAPASMKGLITACWLMTMSLADVFNGLVTPYYETTLSLPVGSISLTPTVYFAGFAVLMVFVTLTFVKLARRFNRLESSTQRDSVK